MIETDALKGGQPDATARLIGAQRASNQEEALERALRPKRLADYVGQRRRGIKNPVYTRDRIPSLEDKAECW